MSDRKLVYSSEHGRITPDRRPETGTARGDGIVRVRREVKGRRGKTVTTVSGVELEPDGLKQLASKLKRACGAGGSVKSGVIEIQGDHRQTVVETLTGLGFNVKKAGG